jgi:hypothetical protein
MVNEPDEWKAGDGTFNFTFDDADKYDGPYTKGKLFRDFGLQPGRAHCDDGEYLADFARAYAEANRG